MFLSKSTFVSVEKKIHYVGDDKCVALLVNLIYYVTVQNVYMLEKKTSLWLCMQIRIMFRQKQEDKELSSIHLAIFPSPHSKYFVHKSFVLEYTFLPLDSGHGCDFLCSI